MAPDQEDLARELEKRMIEHNTRSEERWNEQWRRNERADQRINDLDDAAGERLSQMEGRMAKQELWQSNIMGRFAALAFIGSALGGVLTSLALKFLAKP